MAGKCDEMKKLYSVSLADLDDEKNVYKNHVIKVHIIIILDKKQEYNVLLIKS